jgi:hypothetical protein
MALEHLNQRSNQQNVSMDRLRWVTQQQLSSNKIGNPVDMRALNVFINRASRSPCAPPRNFSPEINPPKLVKEWHELNDADRMAILHEFLQGGRTNH